MARPPADRKPHATFLGIAAQFFASLTGAKPILEAVGDLVAQRADRLVRQGLKLVAAYGLLLAGLAVVAGGVMQLIIDFTPLPRGLVLILGGLVLVAGSSLFLQFGKRP